MKAAIYRTAGGEILRTIDCPVDMLDMQAGDGEAVLVGDVSDLTHFVLEGVLTAYTEEQAAAKAATPTYFAAWDNATMGWVDLRELERVREERWEAMKLARDAFEFGGFNWGGSRFDSDPTSQGRIQGAALMASLALTSGEPFSVEWTLQSNEVRILSGEEMIRVGLALSAHVSTAHEIGRSLRRAIEGESSARGLANIKWPT